MHKYEYMTKFIEVGTFSDNVHDLEYQNLILQEFNKLGNDCWELVSCVASNQGFGDTGVIMAVFKRIIEEKR